MSFLDAIPAEISEAFAADFRDAMIGTATQVPDGEGGFTYSYDTEAVKALRLEYSLDYRTRNQIPGSDVQIIVLRYGVVSALSTDSQITLGGTTYKVMAIESDPAEATWTAQARPI